MADTTMRIDKKISSQLKELRKEGESLNDVIRRLIADSEEPVNYVEVSRTVKVPVGSVPKGIARKILEIDEISRVQGSCYSKSAKKGLYNELCNLINRLINHRFFEIEPEFCDKDNIDDIYNMYLYYNIWYGKPDNYMDGIPDIKEKERDLYL